MKSLSFVSLRTVSVGQTFLEVGFASVFIKLMRVCLCVCLWYFYNRCKIFCKYKYACMYVYVCVCMCVCVWNDK
jgi:hypothetical protein